ncbi:unnamed protein product [Amoebophrya sp. A25]|nr:unnamed protein product [Amoebophrya sp. A25]|eukprot:GSA25T00009580001.1
MMGSSGTAKPKEPSQVEPGMKGMTDKRKEKLLALQKREQMKDVLIERFKARVNGGPGISAKTKKQNEEIVKSEVESFLNSASITETNLKKLDKKIRSRTGSSAADEDSRKGSNVSGVEAYSNLQATMKLGSAVSGSGVGGAEKEESSLVADWRVLDDYALFLEGKSQLDFRLRKVESGAKVRSALGKQVKELKDMKQGDKDADRRWYARALADVELYEKEERDKANEMKRLAMLEKQMRDEQLLDEDRQRQEQKKIDALEDRLTKKRVQDEIQREEEKMNKIRQQQKDHQANVQAENVKDQERRRVEKLRQVEQDKLLMERYNAAADEVERKRQEEKDARVARNDAAMARMASTVTAAQDAAVAEADRRAEAHAKRSNEMAAQAAADKEARLRKMRLETREVHMKQMAERIDEKQRLKDEARRQLLQTIEDEKKYNAKETEKKMGLKKRELANQDELNRMMAEKGDRLKEVEMSATEKKMNKELLKQVNSQLRAAGMEPKKVGSPVKKKVDPEVAIRFGLKLPEDA